MKAPLILIVSKKMDSNKKKDRYEDSLIRMGEKARASLGLADQKTVELWPDGSSKDRIYRSRVLKIFKAYSGDLKSAKTKVSEEDYDRVGFVTSRTFDIICRDKRKKKENIWIADTIEDTVVGADPEFILFKDDGRVKYAAEVPGFHFDDQLGSDGPLAEIRPEPDTDVGAFVKNIQDILQHHKNVSCIQPYQWLGGCYHYGLSEDGREREWPIGGHIHLGTPGKLSSAIGNHNGVYHHTIYSCLSKLLDEYLAIPMIRLDGTQIAAKRRNQYGNYGDFKTDHGRLEYRVLSGEWLTHPKLASAVIGTAKAIAHAFFKLLDEADYEKSMIMTKSQLNSNDYANFRFFDNSFSSWKDIEIMRALDATTDSGRMSEILRNGKIKFTKTFFNKLAKRLTSMSSYREYSEYIDTFIELINLPDDLLAERDKDLKHTWVENEEFII